MKMNNKKATKRALLTSVMALAMCVVMLIGTTFAWFTDTATANVNKIQSGTLDIELVKADGTAFDMGEALKWKTQDTGEVLWEPNCTYDLDGFRIKNAGNLAVKYKVVLQAADITKSANGKTLLDVIDWTVTMTNDDGTTRDILAAATQTGLKNGIVILDGETLLPNKTSGVISVKGHMDANAGNDYQNLTIDNFAITVYATQAQHEFDSNDNTYDAGALYPVVAVSQVTVDSENKTTGEKVFYSPTTISATDTTPVAKVTVPSGVLVTNGATQVTLTVDETAEPANFTVGADQTAKTFEIKMAEVDPNNTEKVTVELYVGTGLLNPVVYHNGVAMDAADYSYNETTGVMTIKTATFSPFTVVSEKVAATVDGTPYKTMDAAIEAAADGSVIVLQNDAADIDISDKNNVTFDFNGYTVTNETKVGYGVAGAIEIYRSTVTLKDSKGTGGAYANKYDCSVYMKQSNVTIDGGTYEMDCMGTGTYVRNLYADGCVLTINKATVKTNARNSDASYAYGVALGAAFSKDLNKQVPSTLVINGGTFETFGNTFAYGVTHTSSGYGASITINDGNFTVVSDTFAKVVSSSQSDGTVVINGGTFTAKGSMVDLKNTSKVFDPGKGTLTVADGISVAVSKK